MHILKKNDAPIKEVMNRFFSGKKKLYYGVTNVTIEQIWKDAMGSFIGKYTSSIKLYDGTLTVKITSAPLRKELSMSPDKVINLINEALGHPLIKQVVFR